MDTLEQVQSDENFQDVTSGAIMITAPLTIFDVTDTASRTKSLELTRRDENNLVLRWTTEGEEPLEGTLDVADWNEFLGLARRREPHRWTSDPQLEGPMGEGGMQNVMRQLTTTPSYQLFLAAIDVAAFLLLPQSGSPERYRFLPFVVARRFGEISGFIDTEIGGGRLFFPASELFAGQERATAELVRNGKIGQLGLILPDGSMTPKNYVPYSVPSGFVASVSASTKNLWDLIRNEYNRRRYS